MLGKQGSVCQLPRPSFLEKHKNCFQCSHEQISGCLTGWVQTPAWQPPGCAALGKWIKMLTVISFPHRSNGQQQDIHESVNIMLIYSISRSPISGLPWWLGSKESACKQKTLETWVWSLGQEEPPEEEAVAHSSILAGKSHGQRSCLGYGPWGCRVGHYWGDWTHTCTQAEYILRTC